MLLERSSSYSSGSRMMFKYVFLIVAVLLIIFLLHKTDKVSYGDMQMFQRPRQPSKFFDTWNDCARKKFSSDDLSPDEFWKGFSRLSAECDTEISAVKSMNIVELRNLDESKYVIYPVLDNGENIFVTLGIGLDISAEKAFKTAMTSRNQNVTFFGADPIVEGNSKIWSEIGTYFPYAVSGSAGFFEASVYLDGTYRSMPVATVDIYYFLDKVLKKKVYDYLWMDAEYAEFEVFDMFYRDGPLDNLGISFCQMSLEVHQVGAGDKRQDKYQTFIKRLIDERRYGFFLSAYVGHNRLWLFNYDSEYCVRKFLPHLI